MTAGEAREVVLWICELFPNINAAQSVEMRQYLTDPDAHGDRPRPGKSLVIDAVKRWNLTHNFLSLAELAEAVRDEQRRRQDTAAAVARARAKSARLDALVGEELAKMSDVDLRELYDSLIDDFPTNDFMNSHREKMRARDPRTSGLVRAALREQLKGQVQDADEPDRASSGANSAATSAADSPTAGGIDRGSAAAAVEGDRP